MAQSSEGILSPNRIPFGAQSVNWLLEYLRVPAEAQAEISVIPKNKVKELLARGFTIAYLPIWG